MLHLVVDSVVERFKYFSLKAFQFFRIVKLAQGKQFVHNLQAILAAPMKLHPISQENVIAQDPISCFLVVQNVSLLK